MSKSMCVNMVRAGGLGYADRIAVDDSDPLSILIAEEDGENANPYPHSSAHCWPVARSYEEI